MLEASDNGGRPQPFPLRRFRHDAMACTFELALVCDDAAYAEQAARAAFTEIDRVERELSRFIPTSDIARINALKPGGSLRIGIEAVECLQLAARICADTNGAFDVSYARREAPLELDPKRRRVRAHAEGVRVDLGGIGKGYAIDQVLQILGDWSVDAGLIQSGQSSVFALGAPPGFKHWSIALRDPVNHAEPLKRVSLRNAALSGSGRKLHGDHIIDPRSGQPVDDRLGAWALAPSAALSDALSTAFMIMSPDEVASFCQEHSEVSALLLIQTDDYRKLLRFGPGLTPDKE